MAVDPSILGRTYPPGEVYEVAREVLRAFAVAAAPGREPHPAHVDAAAARALGHADVLAPPTFAVVLAQRSDARLVTDPSAGIDFSRVVHGEQRFTHHRPIVAGDRLLTTLHVDAVRSAGGNDLVTTRNEITSEAGEAVCTTTSLIVVRGAQEAA